MNRFLSSALLALTCISTSTHAQEAARNYPVKAITLIVSYAAGGNADLRMRQMSPVLAQILGRSIIVENKPGAGGNIGTELVAKAAPDGYTIGVGSFAPLAVNHALFPKLGFDPLKDFEPIILIEKTPLVLTTRLDKPYKSVADVIAAARTKPGTLSIGNAGTGGAHHLVGELFQRAAKIELIAVPFRGGGPAGIALLGRQIEMMFEQPYNALPGVLGGKTRALVVSSDTRLPNLPDVPTFAELGYPELTASNWMGMIAPRGTPPEIIAKLNDAFNKALAHPEVRPKMREQSGLGGGGSSADFAAWIRAEWERWGKLVRTANIKAD